MRNLFYGCGTLSSFNTLVNGTHEVFYGWAGVVFLVFVFLSTRFMTPARLWRTWRYGTVQYPASIALAVFRPFMYESLYRLFPTSFYRFRFPHNCPLSVSCFC